MRVQSTQQLTENRVSFALHLRGEHKYFKAQSQLARSLSEYWGAVANRGLVSRARGEGRTAMALIVYVLSTKRSAT